MLPCALCRQLFGPLRRRTAAVSPLHSPAFWALSQPRQQLCAPPQGAASFAAHSAVPRPPSCASTAQCAAEWCTSQEEGSAVLLQHSPAVWLSQLSSSQAYSAFSSAPPASTTGIPGRHVPKASNAPGAPVLATPCRPEAAVQHRQGRVVHVDKRAPGGRRRNPGQAQPRGCRVQAPVGHAGTQVA